MYGFSRVIYLHTNTASICNAAPNLPPQPIVARESKRLPSTALWKNFDSIKFIHLTWLRQIKTQSPGGVFILPACSQHFFGFRPHYDITEFLQPQMTLCLFGVGFSVPLGTVFMVPGGQRNLSIWFNCCSLLQSSDRSHHSRCAPAQIFSYPAYLFELDSDSWKNTVVIVIISCKKIFSSDISGDPIWIPGDPRWGHDPKVEKHSTGQ